jgi:hypothetical protein
MLHTLQPNVFLIFVYVSKQQDSRQEQRATYYKEGERMEHSMIPECIMPEV